jgi:hypothetical protein
MVDLSIFLAVYFGLFCSFFSVLFAMTGFCDGVDLKGDVLLFTLMGAGLGFIAGIIVSFLWLPMLISMGIQKILGVWR